jgi:hypothetical protein
MEVRGQRSADRQKNMKKIEDIIALGESETVEFKTAFNKDVIETAVAFANTRVVSCKLRDVER